MENPNNTHFTHALAVDFELIGTEFPDPSNILCKLRMNEDKSKIIIKENNVGNCHRVSDCVFFDNKIYSHA